MQKIYITFEIDPNPFQKGMMKTEEERCVVNNVSQGVLSRRNKSQLIAMSLLVVCVFGNEIFNLYETYYEANASLTLLYGFLHIVYEWYRAVIYFVILYGLISFLIFLRKGEGNQAKGLSIIASALSLHLVINFFPSLNIIFAPESMILIVLVLIVFLGYNIVLIGYLRNWVKYLSDKRKNAPNPLLISMFLIGFSLFLIFHYFYMQFGGNYGVRANQPQFMINTPFLKIALMLLLQIAMLFAISVMSPADKKEKTLHVITMILGGFAFITISTMSVIEGSMPHYRFSVFENDPDTPIRIQITNGSSSITPIAFYIGDEIIPTDRRNMDDYLRSYGFDPSTSLNDVPSIDTKLIVTLSMDRSTLLSEVYVYDTDKNMITEIHNWYDLDRLSSGTYYIFAQLLTIGDPCDLYGEYFFILNVE